MHRLRHAVMFTEVHSIVALINPKGPSDPDVSQANSARKQRTREGKGPLTYLLGHHYKI